MKFFVFLSFVLGLILLAACSKPDAPTITGDRFSDLIGSRYITKMTRKEIRVAEFTAEKGFVSTQYRLDESGNLEYTGFSYVWDYWGSFYGTPDPPPGFRAEYKDGATPDIGVIHHTNGLTYETDVIARLGNLPEFIEIDVGGFYKVKGTPIESFQGQLPEFLK